MSAEVNEEDAAMVDALDEVWTRIAALGAGLTEEEWKRPTEVPGWSVQDNMTHLTDLEAMILGRPAPDHAAPDGLAHVKNDPGVRNERFVDARRGWTGADALAEFIEVTHARVAQLRSYSVEDFAADSWTPMGPGTVHDLLPFRVFDSWVHEQDMRRAVGQPGGLGGGAAEASMERITGTAGYVIGKKAAAPEGTTVVIELEAPLAQTMAIGVEGGRARTLDAVPDAPTVRLVTDGETYARLACGRGDPAAARAAGSVRIEGDEELGARIVDELNFLF
jgi:uncharacterized protein (TIGR03083 family)